MAVLFDDNIQFLVIKNESEEVVEKLKRYHVVVKGDREDTRSGIAIEVTEAGKISSVFRANLNTASFEILRKSQQLKTDFKQTRQTILDHLNDVKKRVKDSAVGGRAGVKSIWWEKDKTSGEMLMNLMEPMKTKSCVLVVLNFKAVMGTELIAYLEELSHSKDLRILDLKKTVEHKDSKICDLRKKLEENEKKLNLDIDKFHKECNEKDDLLEYAKEKNEILNDKIKELQEHINDLVEQVGEMQEDEKESKNEMNIVCAENDELRNLQKRYENALEKVYNENQTLIAQVTECEDELQKASDELLVQQKLLTSEKREHSKGKKIIMKFKEHEKSLKEANEAQEVIIKKLKVMNEKLSEDQMLLAKVQEESQEKDSQITILSSRIEQLKNEIYSGKENKKKTAQNNLKSPFL